MAVTREQRTERLQRDRAAAVARGQRVGGPPPFGWRWERGELVAVPGEQATSWLVQHLTGQGWSVRRIAEQLDALGIAPRQGAKWHPATVHRIARSRELRAHDLEDTG